MRSQLIRFFFFLLLVPSLLAQASEPVDLEMVARIREEAFERSQVMQHAAVLTQEIGPRLTGSPNLDRAKRWAAQQFSEMGLARPRLEQWEPFSRGWEKQSLSLRLLTPEPQELEAIALPWSPPTRKPVQARIVHLEATELEQLRQYRGKLRGAFVLQSTILQRPSAAPQRQQSQQEGPRRLDEAALERLAQSPEAPAGPRDPDAARRRTEFQRALRELLSKEKPLAVVRRSSRAQTVAGSGGSGTGVRAGEPAPYATLIVSQSDFAHLQEALKADPGVQLSLDLRARFFRAPPQYNVLADLPGSDKRGEVVMLGAHLDSVHIGAGATDNAAGSAVVMEAMRILKALGVQPRRTIRVALWGGEEQGLLGSRHYVRTYLARRTSPEELLVGPGYHSLSAYFNMDNGSGRFRGIFLQGNEDIRPIFEAWMQPLGDLGVTVASPRSTGSTDHVPFDSVGIPAFQFIQDPLDYDTLTHHTHRDTYEMLDPDDLKQAAAVLAVFVYHAAMRDDLLPRKTLENVSARPGSFRPLTPAD